MHQPRLRVLHVVPDLRFGGLQTFVRELSRVWEGHEEFEVGVLTLERLGAPVERLDGCRPYRLSHMGRASMLYPGRLAGFIRAWGADVVHIHSGVWYKAAFAARLARVPRVIYTEHGRAHHDPWIARCLARVAVRNSDRIVAVCGAVARYLADVLGVPRHKLVVLPNGVDHERFCPAPRPDGLAKVLDIPQRAFVIGSVGRLEAVKRYDLLLAAFARIPHTLEVRGRAVEPHLILVGDGPRRGQLLARAAELRIADRVRFVRWRRDTWRFYALFDLFVLCSTHEGMPISLLEAMACGVAPVATEVGGVPEILDGELAAQLIPANDPAALAGMLRRMMNDGGLRRRIAASGRQRILERHTLGHTLRGYAALYRGEDLVAVSSRRGATTPVPQRHQRLSEPWIS